MEAMPLELQKRLYLPRYYIRIRITLDGRYVKLLLFTLASFCFTKTFPQTHAIILLAGLLL